MFTSSACVFSANYQARSLAAVKGCTVCHRFLVGTCSVKESNEESNQLVDIVNYSHPGQVWVTEPSSNDASLFITSAQYLSGTKGVQLLKMTSLPDSDMDIANRKLAYKEEKAPLETMASFNFRDSSTFVNAIKWHSTKDIVLTSDPKHLSSWAITESDVQLSAKVDISSTTVKDDIDVSEFKSGAICWDPHNSNLCAVTCDSNLHLVDTRKMAITSTSNHIHRGCVRDVDFNPNKPLTFLTAGDDRKIKIWDTRNMQTPVKTLEGHTHWVWSAKYNPFHDQLILSGGSDNMVNLWRMASHSSAPWMASNAGALNEEVEADAMVDPPDIKIKSMDLHEECVYSIAWSAAEAWMYCSLSYEGRK